MTQTIRVVMLLISYHAENFGGAEVQVASLAPLLRDRGVDLHILAHAEPGLPSYEELNGIPVYRSPKTPLKALAFSAYSVNKIRQLRPDVLHAHSLFSPTLAANIAGGLFNIPVVSKILRGGILGDVDRIKNKTLGNYRMSNMAKNVDGFIMISEEIRNELITEGVAEEKCHYIPNGVDINRFQSLSDDKKQALRQELNVKDVPTAIFVGRLDPEKCVDNLINSWKEVHREHPEAQLLIVGIGEDEAELKELAGDNNVHFIGRVDNVEQYLQIADLYILPSSTEGLSNSLLEAMASELPIIVTSVGAAPDLIETRDNGWCIPPNDQTALTEALLEAFQMFFNNPEQIKQLGKNNRDRILRDFQLSVTADKLLHLYKDVSSFGE